MGSRVRRGAVVLAVVIALGALVTFAVNDVLSTRHSEACAVYGDALTAALSNPQDGDPAPTSVDATLGSGLVKAINKSRATYQKEARTESAAIVTSAWSGFEPQFKATAMANHGC